MTPTESLIRRFWPFNRSKAPVNVDVISTTWDNADQDFEHETEHLSYLRLFTLSCALGGLQVVWAVVLSNGTSYLLSLRLSKSWTALVWMAAPICGAVVQPIVGAISDRSQSSWGRRRPFIVWGTALSVISMLSLAWCTQVVGMFPIASETCRRNWVLAFAMVSVYVLNIAVQPIQLGLRTLVIECCPQHQQSQASSWASYSIGIGSIAGYAAASSDLPFLFNCDWISQFQYLVILASAALVITVGVTCLSVVEEQSSTMTNLEAPALLGILAMPRSLLTTLKELPLRIRRICHIQFFAWLAWFPVLYYGAEYVGEFYITASIYQIQTAHEDAAQIGSFAFLLFAMVALSTNIGNAFLPLAERKLGMDSSFRKPPQPFHSLSLPKSGIVWAWFASHVLFATSMLATVIIDSWIGGTILVATLGVSWAMTTWAPYSIIGSEVSLHAGGEALGGTIMSLHNVAISTPQVLAAVISSFVFEVATTVGGNGTAWLLRAGGISALVAAWLTLNLDVDDTNLDS